MVIHLAHFFSQIARFAPNWLFLTYSRNKSSMVTSFCTMFQYSLCDTPYVVIIVRWREQRVEVVLRNDSILFCKLSA